MSPGGNTYPVRSRHADAGPFWMRINPHLITEARKSLENDGHVIRLIRHNTPWYYRRETKHSVIKRRLAIQEPVRLATLNHQFQLRLGQTLEIATYRALLAQSQLQHFGSFSDLGEHGDDRSYSKEEPPGHLSGRSIGDKRLDFLVLHPRAGFAGLEIKNVREWMYPDRAEVKDLVYKCVTLNVVPVLIARRVPFVSFKLMYRCGIIVHQTYNQFYPSADAALAAKVRDKTILGYHDVRTGNLPDARLLRFLTVNLPSLIPEARVRFDAVKDLLASYVDDQLNSSSFAAQVRQRVERQGRPPPQ